MTMSFLPYDALEPITPFEPGSGSNRKAVVSYAVQPQRIKIPVFPNAIKRPRVDALLARSVKQYPATLLCGRSGTGKTVLAANYARLHKRAAWLSVESPDVDWRSFSAGLGCAVRRGRKSTVDTAKSSDPTIEEIAPFLETLFRRRALPTLVVLDNVHHLLDTPWFATFLEHLVASVPGETHILLLSRSKPPTPIWRMRSKRFLSVIEEKVYGFDESEVIDLFLSIGLPKTVARAAYRCGFGNIEQMLRVSRTLQAKTSPDRL